MMQDRDLDKIMAKWADDETASAPKLRPTAEMYERVAALGRKRVLGSLLSRRLVWVAAGAALAVFVLVYALVHSSFLIVPGMGQQRAHVSQRAQVSQRAAFAPGKGPARGGPPPKGKGPAGGPAHLKQLEFQVKGLGSSVVRSIDLLAQHLPRVVLTAEDSYRLVLEPAADRHVYVYQRSPSGTLVALYPNEAHSPARNPVHAGGTVYLPAEPNGFYLEKEEGVVRLYVVAAEEPVPELEALYDRYSRPGLRLGRQRNLDLLLERLDALASGQIAGASGWTFEFEVR
jgi:hypothetical protein